MGGHEALRQRIQDSFDRQGLMRTLGARLGEVAPGEVHIHLPKHDGLLQQRGYFHAGASGAIVDSAGGYAALTMLPEDKDVVSVEYKINLVAPAVGDELEAVGTVIRSGRTISTVRLEVFSLVGQERKLVVAGQQTIFAIDA